MKLESRDLNGMKQIPELDRGSPVFIKLSKGAVSDMSNVEIEEKVLKNTSAIVLDTVAPLLTEFTYNATTLTIKFSEPVKNGTYIGEKFYLANSSSTPYSFVSLRGSRVVTNTDKQVITVDVTANLDDINKNNKLCTDDDDCFMIHDAGAIADVSNNPIQKRDFANALAVSSYINDVNPPVLQSIESFDLNKGQLTLSFSEVVHGGGIDFTKIQLRQFFSLSDPNAKTKTLTQGISSPSYGKIITLTLREDDLNTIKTTDNFCVSTFSCFLSYEAGFVKDSSGAPIVASSSESQSFRIGLRPQKIIEDTTKPVLTNYTMDMNSGGLFLTFSEPMNSGEFSPEDISFQSKIDDDTASLSLKTGISKFRDQLNEVPPRASVTNFSTVFSFVLTEDLDLIKSSPSLAKSADTIFMIFSKAMIRDKLNNEIVEVLATNGKAPGVFIPDTKSPVLQTFESIDIENGVLSLSFSEAVDKDSIVLSDCFILNANSNSPSIELSLENSSSTYTNDDNTKTKISIALSQATKILFKKQASLKNICARGQSNCFVKMKASSIKDTSGNELSQAVTKAVVQNPVDDSVPPQLLSFAFDSSREEIVLTFNDVMEVSTLNTKKITFQSSPGSNPVAAHTLSGDYSAQLTAGQSFEIKLQLTSEDVNKIKLDANLATTSANTYASVDLLAAQDVFGNLLTSITPSNAKKVSNFTADTKAPELFAFSVNLNQTDAELGLTFTEPVKLSSFQYPLITLHGEKNSNQDTTHTLNDVGGHSATISSSGRVVTIAVAHKDVNEIKALSGLANKRERALLSLAEGVVSDMNDIKSTSLSVLNARTADTYIADEFAPVMTKFDLDMDTAQLTLYFSETVNTGSLDLDGELVIVDAASGSGTESVTLSGFVSFSSVDSSTIRVNLTNSDITSLQQRYGLATTNMTTYAEVRSGQSGIWRITRSGPRPAVSALDTSRVIRRLPAWNHFLWTWIRPQLSSPFRRLCVHIAR